MSAEGEIKSFVERVLRIKAEQDELAQDAKEIYKEAKGRGFSTKVISSVVGYVRKRDRKPDDVAEQDALFELYLAAYEGPSTTGTENATRAAQREASGSSNGRTSEFDSGNGGSNPSPETIDPLTGEIIEPDHTSKSTAARNGAGNTGVTAGETANQSQSEQPCTATGPSASTGNASNIIPATNLPDPHLPTLADGQEGIPSSAADGAKTVGVRAPITVGSAQAGSHYVQAGQAVTNSQSSRAPVETDPLREQADVKTAGTNPRETRPSASVALTNQQPGPQSNSHARPSSPSEAHKADDAPPPASSAIPFDNPRCKHPETCHLAHSEDSCLDCVLTWAKLPKDEQVQRWADAHGVVA